MRLRQSCGLQVFKRASDLFESLESRTHLSATSITRAATGGTIDLTGAITVTSKVTTVKQGHSLIFAVIVANAGTATASGILQMNLSLGPQPDGAAATDLGILRSAIHLKPAGSETLHFVRAVSLETPAGTYFYVITVDPNDLFNESNTANNTAVSTNSFTVLPLYPILSSSYSGSVGVIGGPDRGNFGDITTYITSESAKGVFSGDGTVAYENGVTDEFTIEGSVSQSGRIVERLLVSTGGPVSLVTASLTGGTITGTYPTQGDLVRFSESAVA